MKAFIFIALLFSSFCAKAQLANSAFWVNTAAPVQVSNVIPESSTAAGGSTVTISGLGFLAGATASIGGNNCTTTTVVSSTSIACVVPANSNIGLQNVKVVNTNATNGQLISGFGYVGSPSLWLKADALALANNASVTSWTDSSGSGNTATTLSGTKPVYQTNVQNGKPTVVFSGAQYMDTTLASTSILKNTILAVHMPTVNGGVIVGANGCCSPHFILVNGMFGTAGTGYVVKNIANGQAVAGDITNTDINSFSIAGGRFNSVYPAADTSTTIDAYMNATHYTATFGASLGTDATNVEIGSRYQGSNYFTGDISEVLVYSSALSDTDLQSAQCYLAHKYGLAVTGC